MTHFACDFAAPRTTGEPLVLTVPGLGNSGPGHWQSRWEEAGIARRVQLGMWDAPHRNTWVNQLNLAIHRAGRPVVLAAHSLGCLAVAWWARYEQPGPDSSVVGALLVAPADVDEEPPGTPLAPFAPTPEEVLPFASVVVASSNDPYVSLGKARLCAALWGSHIVEVGPLGHINADSSLGDWPLGQTLLRQLCGAGAAPTRPGAFQPTAAAMSEASPWE